MAVEASADQQHSESVVVSVAEASGYPAGEFDEPVDRLSATVVGAAGGEVGKAARRWWWGRCRLWPASLKLFHSALRSQICWRVRSTVC